jgi:hypothetical protein
MTRRALLFVLWTLATQPALADEASGSSAATSRVVLGRFTTSYVFDAEHKSRAFNVELAAEAINGKIIAAGGTFSFNDAVGERTAAFGYAKAIVIRDGMIAEGTGGGACQVASTLHAAALLSNLDVAKRAPHSRPSAYIRMGLDATVAFGGTTPAIDLKLANPLSSAVAIRARAAKGTLEVWFDAAGIERPDVTLTSEIVETTKYPRVVERDKSITDDLVRVKAFGIPGFRVKRTREVRARAADGTIQRDVRVDTYAPTPEIMRVAPSFDAARLHSHDESPAPPAIVDPGVVRPALVQLRPSTLVTLNNSERY